MILFSCTLSHFLSLIKKINNRGTLTGSDLAGSSCSPEKVKPAH